MTHRPDRQVDVELTSSAAVVAADRFKPLDRAPLAAHRRLRGYAPTPLVAAPSLAAQLGLTAVWIKDESCRLELPAFKILGAWWAVLRLLEVRLGVDLDGWRDVDDVRARVAALGPLRLVTATDGNHGRAVARVARSLGWGARILVPAGTARARIDAIAGEGAEVEVVDGTYDDAVELAATAADARTQVVSDTAWAGDDTVPRWVIEGYSTIFWEVDDQLAERAAPPVDLVVIPIGVGALAAAAVRHYRRAGGGHTPRLVGVEPTTAACALVSARAGEPTEVAGPHDSIMAGLNCGRVSPVAWPLVSAGFDAFVAVGDGWARDAMRRLAALGLEAGETGAASLAGLQAALSGSRAERVRGHLGLGRDSRALILVSEGTTDPASFRTVVGSPPRGSRPAE
ncbi:MAG TPA: diaminopropionate ammonia-lyase [Nitriliruptorales bacterium]|nr:diaminopropionate ammonia-lyase [Nitriliruptorales bacterium]